MEGGGRGVREGGGGRGEEATSRQALTWGSRGC